MAIIKDEEGRTITIDKHEDRGVLLPNLEPLPWTSIGPHHDETIRRMQTGNTTTPEQADKIIKEADKGGARTEERTAKARHEQARQHAKKDEKPRGADVDLSKGVRAEDRDDVHRGGIDTMKSPNERREAGTAKPQGAQEQMK